jgi:hypothetical protein
MILNQYGRPAKRSLTWDGGRRGDQTDAFQMANGAIVSESASLALHRKIVSDPVLRDRIESAQKIVGKETLHMALIRRDTSKKSNIEEIIKTNVRAGETVIRERAQNENLTESKKAYEKIAV